MFKQFLIRRKFYLYLSHISSASVQNISVYPSAVKTLFGRMAPYLDIFKIKTILVKNMC